MSVVPRPPSRSSESEETDHIRVFSPDTNAPVLSVGRVDYDALLGSWDIVYSTLPLWRNKKNVCITYALVPGFPASDRLDDLVEYHASVYVDSRKTPRRAIRGIDRRELPSGIKDLSTVNGVHWRWRGKGFLMPITSDWQILGLHLAKEHPLPPDRDEWIVSYFQATLFSPAGLDIYARTGSPPVDSERMDKIIKALQSVEDTTVAKLAKDIFPISHDLPTTQDTAARAIGNSDTAHDAKATSAPTHDKVAAATADRKHDPTICSDIISPSVWPRACCQSEQADHMIVAHLAQRVSLSVAMRPRCAILTPLHHARILVTLPSMSRVSRRAHFGLSGRLEIFREMLCDDAHKLVAEAKRAQQTDLLRTYNSELVRLIQREARQLGEQITAGEEVFSQIERDEGQMASIVVSALAMQRNKRCLFAYHRSRLNKIKQLFWDEGATTSQLLGQEEGLRKELSPAEVEFIKDYAALVHRRKISMCKSASSKTLATLKRRRAPSISARTTSSLSNGQT
ncbi:uncharacterized protein L969DRAFT_47938 [Mixia osmundae IAM 14324]|uniref:DNA replication complex GINS protein PSF1 n=1 Tax=Mixia osmundae (strain CBS 9802 / IAM 14324 / JCM 22182 / KY 12970) TaxID=764103 RepID=G7E945_MIXOS|nr:uncharacterized protein L969DRAFT_47938 [Mixia osmundae IAM 14324]KEI40298.1 hypothetical protein L969DRAFT_47938 [Mixia osmundae IAM 14324]GAA99663.1 hypothetical protein E5Q_06366 [Mixia osmundae IAM 14324]